VDPNTGLPPRVEVPKTDWFDPDKSANAPRKAGLLLLTAGRCCWPPQALSSMPSRRRRGRRTRCRVFAEPRPAGAYRGATLEVRDKDKTATFSGNVRVTQGDTGLRCKLLQVFYGSCLICG